MRRKKKYGHESEFEDLIDLTPVINVALILLVVFMCVSPMALMTGINAVSSKKGVSLGKTSKSDKVNVRLDKDRNIFINKKSVSWENFAEGIKWALANSKKPDVIITADRKNIVKDVVELLDISKQNGAKKVVIMN